jgi:predicted secreted hydrolase
MLASTRIRIRPAFDLVALGAFTWFTRGLDLNRRVNLFSFWTRNKLAMKNQNLLSFFNDPTASLSAVFDSIADTLTGSTDPLRDGSEHEPVQLPRDLAAHANVQTEWWYYTGHATTVNGREFGFELVFFKRRTDLDRFSVLPLRLIGNPYYFAHFAITDLREPSFRYAHRKSSNGHLELPAAASEENYYVSLGDWSVRDAGGTHILRAALPDGTGFEASLTPVKPVVLNGENGVSFKDKGEASRYFSYTRMEIVGDLIVKGKPERFTGIGWMDREFGTWEPTEDQKGWDWISIQLDDGSDLMCYQLRNSRGERSTYSSGTFVDAHGNSTALKNSDFSMTALEFWMSPKTGATYPVRWAVSLPQKDLELQVSAAIRDQELDTRGTTMIVYWEGACRVIGTSNANPVRGNAYLEMVGYDRSHEQPNLAYFLFGNPF